MCYQLTLKVNCISELVSIIMVHKNHANMKFKQKQNKYPILNFLSWVNVFPVSLLRIFSFKLHFHIFFLAFHAKPWLFSPIHVLCDKSGENFKPEILKSCHDFNLFFLLSFLRLFLFSTFRTFFFARRFVGRNLIKYYEWFSTQHWIHRNE